MELVCSIYIPVNVFLNSMMVFIPRCIPRFFEIGSYEMHHLKRKLSVNPFCDWEGWTTAYWKEIVCHKRRAEVQERFRAQQRKMWARLPQIFNLTVND